jgi:phospholipid N-methyltransferase
MEYGHGQIVMERRAVRREARDPSLHISFDHRNDFARDVVQYYNGTMMTNPCSIVVDVWSTE